MAHGFRLALMFPVFAAAFVGNAAWDFADKLVRRGEVVRNVNLRYDKVMTRRMKEIELIERQDALRQQSRDRVVVLEFESTPPRPITWFDVDGKTPDDTRDYLRQTAPLKLTVPPINFPPLPVRKRK